jgi:hypothetical protein
MANFINTILDPQVPEEAVEIQQRENIANKQSEQFEYLFNLYKAMTPLEGRRRYIQHFKIDCGERVPGARYEDLISKGIIYKSSQRVMEENGALNYVWKLLPKDGSIPEDYNMKKQKISVEIQFNETTGEIDEQKTLEVFFDKFDKYREKNNL